MDIPSSTSIPVPTFGSAAGEASPARFLEFLNTLISEQLSERVPIANKAHWTSVISGLSDHFLAPFPSHIEFAWSALHERIKLTDVTLEVIRRANEQVEGLLEGSPDFVKRLFVRLLDLSKVLEIWTRLDVPKEEGIASPKDMHERAFGVLVSTLRSLGGNANILAKPEVPMWRTLREILLESLGLCQDLITMAPTYTRPLSVKLFGNPRLQQAPVGGAQGSEDDGFLISVDRPSHISTLLSLLISVVSSVLHPTTLCAWYLNGTSCQAVEISRLAYDFCSSSACSAPAAVRAKALSEIVRSCIPLPDLSSNLGDGTAGLVETLMLKRIQDGPRPEWEEGDALLRSTLESAPTTIIPTPLAASALLGMLHREAWGEPGMSLRMTATVYLHPSVLQLPVSELSSARDIFSRDEYLGFSGTIRDDIQRRMDNLASHDAGTRKTFSGPSAHAKEPATWRIAVKDIVQDIIAPSEVRWMDDDGSFRDIDYVQFALRDISQRFMRPLVDITPDSRVALAKRIAELTCLLAHPSRTQCPSESTDRPLKALAAFSALISRLLDGSADDVPPRVRSQVYKTLRTVMTHQAPNVEAGLADHLRGLLDQGLVDRSRTVRLAAGYALTSFVCLLRAGGTATAFLVENLFLTLDGLLESGKEVNKETTLIAVERIGETSVPELLGRSVRCLVAQLGKDNPVLRGTAYLQLLSLAQYHDKSPYTLLSSHMSTIAPFLVSRISTQPNSLYEMCRFLSIGHVEFIDLTLHITLPQLFASCERKALEKVAETRAQKLSTLFVNNMDHILARIFLMPTEEETDQAVAFVLDTLNSDASSAVSMEMIINSCIEGLLTDIVVAMGNESKDGQEVASRALRKIEGYLAQQPASRGTRSTAPTADSLLRRHVLALVSHLTKMLHENAGKKSPEAKRHIVRGLGALMVRLGPEISTVAPQIMACMQTLLTDAELVDVALLIWHTFLRTLRPEDVGQHVGVTSASFVSFWSSFSPEGRALAQQSLEYLVCDMGEGLGRHLDDVVNLSDVEGLEKAQETLEKLRSRWTPKQKMQCILERAYSDNLTVATRALLDLKTFMLATHSGFIADLSSGDVFDPLVGQIMAALFAATCRDGEGAESIHLLAFECIGVLGALDPDRFEIGLGESRMIMMSNFTDEEESMLFALHLVRDVLVGAYRSTSDITYQRLLAYAIQELLKFCKFTSSLVDSHGSIAMRIRRRWNGLPKHVLETVTPLLNAHYTFIGMDMPALQHPIYPSQSTYREWLQLWAAHLISRVSGAFAKTIFDAFLGVVRNRDAGVAHHLLPHLVLNVLLSGDENESQQIRLELMAVLQDQLSTDNSSTAEKRLLSAQAVFMLVEHLNKWVRVVRQDISKRKAESKRSRVNQIDSLAEEQLLRVDSVLSSIDRDLMAKAALRCKAYALSLMNFEQQVVALRQHSPRSQESQEYYERLHEIYANLDEPDGMEGVSTLIISPSLEHQIRQHESTGRWTSAQSCWEVRLQQSPDNLEFHLGLLRCLRNLGHYDTLRTHVKGVLTRNPEWEAALAGFHVESSWMVGDWTDVGKIVAETKGDSSQVTMARTLLSLHAGDGTVSDSLSAARLVLGAPIVSAGATGYRRAYNAVLDLHLVHELQVIHEASSYKGNSQERRTALDALSTTLAARLDLTLPTFRIREPVLSLRRTAFGINAVTPRVQRIVAHSWLTTAKLARKANHWQTAYSAMLQARQNPHVQSFMENVKLLKATGEPLRALQELENSLRGWGLIDPNDDVIDLTEDDRETKRLKAKAQVLRARWMSESERFEPSAITKVFQDAIEISLDWESSRFHLGRYYDDCYKSFSEKDQKGRGTKTVLHIVRQYLKAIVLGSKYIYQTVPRLLTLWLDLGEDRDVAETNDFQRINKEVSGALADIPVYKWYTAFPQIVSRVDHKNKAVYKVLRNIIALVIQELPKQSLWLFAAVVKSKNATRQERGMEILTKLRNNPKNSRNIVPILINECNAMTAELLEMCNAVVKEDRKAFSMKKDFPALAALTPSKLIIPLQESLTASLPPTSSSASHYHPFPVNAPTFQVFQDEIEIMRSLAKPRKVTITGDNGMTYMFLGKPKDDLRKDARLMDFNAVINKILKANSESRRRQLHIRTYGVVTLNEECGFIQWVPNTIPIRPVLVKSYDARGIKSWVPSMNEVFARIKESSDKEAGQLFVTKILPQFPPVFHEWFIETFPEPSAWLASRLAYGRTAAVMSMVGFILGLGDRHCENILLDTNSGDVVHVDFNCLFEKGKNLETPERVPFRLTQNMVDGLGVTGVEGVFRIACEVTMQLLRDNKDTLMSVLDAFIHDPLVEWEDEKRKKDRLAQQKRNQNTIKPSIDLRGLAKSALLPIEKKLKGNYSTSVEKKAEKEVSTSNLVQMLIQEATDSANLGKMYPGWAPWH